MKNPQIAYHWIKEDMTAGSGSEGPWAVGEERTCKGTIELCHSGYHSSPTLLQALNYAPGTMACIVEISQPLHHDKDKQVSRRRKLVAAVNVRMELLTWAADCAERALVREREAGREPDRRSWAAIEVLRRYVAGNATEEDVRNAVATAANTAAYAAAYAATAAYAANTTAYAAKQAEQEWQAARFEELVLAKLHGEEAS
jgi:hypothetical protein